MRERKKRGFRRGFFTSLLIVAVLTVIYVYSPQIVAAVPALEPVMTGYIGTVDQARVWLDSHVTSLLMWLDTTAVQDAPARKAGFGSVLAMSYIFGADAYKTPMGRGAAAICPTQFI